MEDKLLYAYPSEVLGEDIAITADPVLVEEEISVSINGELSDSLSVYPHIINFTDGRSAGVLAFKDPKDDMRRMRNIFTTGLTPEEYILDLYCVKLVTSSVRRLGPEVANVLKRSKTNGLL